MLERKTKFRDEIGLNFLLPFNNKVKLRLWINFDTHTMSLICLDLENYVLGFNIYGCFFLYYSVFYFFSFVLIGLYLWLFDI